MKPEFFKRTWAEVDLDILGENIRQIRSFLSPGCKLMCVVKADAYGHGDHYCAREMAKNSADWFAVSNLNEALSLRDAGITLPVLILGTTPPEFAGILSEQNITQTVFSSAYAAALQDAALAAGVVVDVHLKIDTGMGRIGFDGFACGGVGEAAHVAAMSNLHAAGIFTHFASADESTPDAESYTRGQYARFLEMVAALEMRGITFPLKHCCNSAATLRYPEMHLDMVRPGIILYGMFPDPCCADILPLRPAMQLKSSVSMVKTLPENRFVSYGRQWVSPSPTAVATVPIGYADGYHRSLSNKGLMLVHGRRARVIGRVCMDQLMLDVTGIPGVAAGDEVTIIGTDGEEQLPVETMAEAAGSFNYEIVCLIGKRVPRLYLRDGTPCGVAQYIAKE